MGLDTAWLYRWRIWVWSGLLRRCGSGHWLVIYVKYVVLGTGWIFSWGMWVLAGLHLVEMVLGMVVALSGRVPAVSLAQGVTGSLPTWCSSSVWYLCWR